MAPERFQGRTGPATDIYAVGATAIAMLTGLEAEKLPHRRRLGRRRGRSPWPPGGPACVRSSFARMLEPDPGQAPDAHRSAAQVRPGRGSRIATRRTWTDRQPPCPGERRRSLRALRLGLRRLPPRATRRPTSRTRARGSSRVATGESWGRSGCRSFFGYRSCWRSPSRASPSRLAMGVIIPLALTLLVAPIRRRPPSRRPGGEGGGGARGRSAHRRARTREPRLGRRPNEEPVRVALPGEASVGPTEDTWGGSRRQGRACGLGRTKKTIGAPGRGGRRRTRDGGRGCNRAGRGPLYVPSSDSSFIVPLAAARPGHLGGLFLRRRTHP